jgi:ABC-type nitrate/sulfonate/bicarbonate transport system substrate-binding protein
MVKLNNLGHRSWRDLRLNFSASTHTLAAVMVLGSLLLPNEANSLEIVNLALTNTNFQMVLYPIAQDRGYMREEGIDLRSILVRSELSIQAMIAGSFQFSMAGTMGLVNVAKGGAPLRSSWPQMIKYSVGFLANQS